MLRKQAAEARKCAVLRIESTFIAARGLLSQGRSGLHLKVDVSTSQLNLWTKHSSIGKFWSPVSFAHGVGFSVGTQTPAEFSKQAGADQAETKLFQDTG